MLKGTLTYRDRDLGEVVYDIYARDGFDNFKIYIMNEDSLSYSNYTKCAYLFDKGYDDKGNMVNPYEDKPTNENRRLDISNTNKYKSNITNKEFCAKVGAFIRYVKLTSKRVSALDDLSNHNKFSVTRHADLKDIGEIDFYYSLITKMKVKGVYVDIEVETIPDELCEEGIFKDLKQKDRYDNILSFTPVKNVAFKLDSRLLGFEYEPVEKVQSTNIFGMYETIEEVIENNPDKNTAWILGRKYEIVSDETLPKIIKEFLDFDGYIAFDTETTGLKINFKSRTGEADQLVGVVLSKEIGTGYYFPLQHKNFKNLCNDDHWYFMERYMKPILEKKKIVVHNAKFDWKVAHIYDIDTNIVYDTMTAFGVTKRYEVENFVLGLKGLARDILGLDMFDLNDFVIGSSFSDSNITFADLPYELVRRYAPADADMTLSIFNFLETEKIIAKYNAKEVFDIEVLFSIVVSYSEFYGYHIDIERLDDLKKDIYGGMEKNKEKLFKLAGGEFNPNSPKQLGKIMYDELKMPEIGSKRSTDKETLKTLSAYEDEEGNPKFPFVNVLKTYREFEGINKNFLKRLPEFSTEDGYIFPEVLPLGTNTGRSSVKNPNYQSYNDVVKHYVTARPGFICANSDFSQIEYRTLASMAKQENLIGEFIDPDLDYHSYQAGRMFNVPYALVTKALRQQSKGINFGLPYGMGDSSLGTRIFGARTKENTIKAGELRRKFFQGQELIEQFFEDVRSEGVNNGYTSTLFGRRRYYHRSKFTVAEIRRQAGNHVIQGTAADIYKIAMNRLFNRIRKENWLGKVLINAFVHDEGEYEVHESIDMYYFMKAWREEFQVTIDGFCPLYAGFGVGRCWYDAKKQDLPPQYIGELIEKADEKDRVWTGDFTKFLKEVKDGYEEYKIRRIREFITADENQGEVIKPVIGGLLTEMTEKAIEDIISNKSSEIAEYNTIFKYPISLKCKGVEMQLDALPLEPVKFCEEKGLDFSKLKLIVKKLPDQIGVFGKYYGVDVSNVDIKAPDEVVIKKEETESESNIVNIDFDDYEFSIEDMLERCGYYIDYDTMKVYITDKPIMYQGVQVSIIAYISTVFPTLISKGVKKPYQLHYYNPLDKSIQAYDSYLDIDGIQTLINIYTSANNTRLAVTRLTV